MTRQSAQGFRPAIKRHYCELGGKTPSHGKIDQALEEFKRLKEASPDFAWAYAWLGLAYLLSSRQARQSWNRERQFQCPEATRGKSILGMRPWAGRIAGRGQYDTRRTQHAIREFTLLTGYIASILFTLGRTDEAFDRLRRAFEERSITMDLWNFLGLPLFEKFRTDRDGHLSKG